MDDLYEIIVKKNGQIVCNLSGYIPLDYLIDDVKEDLIAEGLMEKDDFS